MKTILSILFLLSLGIVSVLSLTEAKSTYHPEFREKGMLDSWRIKTTHAYPPGVGILTNSPNCLSCHSNNGPWKDDPNTIIDILDKDTKKSLKQADGSFVIETARGVSKTVLTVLGSKKHPKIPAPYRNAWLYIDPATIGKNTLSKFAPGWEVNLPMSCRLAGDTLKGFGDAHITSLPMTIKPTETAQDAEISLQVMLTKGESKKYNARNGMTGNYFEKKVLLKIK